MEKITDLINISPSKEKLLHMQRGGHKLFSRVLVALHITLISKSGYKTFTETARGLSLVGLWHLTSSHLIRKLSRLNHARCCHSQPLTFN